MYQSVRSFKIEAGKFLKEYTNFLKSLKGRKIKGLNYRVRALHQEAFDVIDCGKCANCCKTMAVSYTRTDIERISKHLGMSEQEYCDQYLGQDPTGDIVHRKRRKPCHFLDANNRCTIYEIRPLVCRRFPHTQRVDFIDDQDRHIRNLNQCPITFHIVKRLRELLDEKGNKI